MSAIDRQRRGSIMVEFSLVGILFFVFLVGIMDLSQFLFVQQAILERARGAARWGAVSDPTNSAAIRNMLLYSQPTTPTNANAPFGLTASTVHVSTAGAGTADYRLVVVVSGYRYQVLSPYLASSYPGAPITVSVPLGLFN